MKKVKVLAVCLLAASMLFAAGKKDKNSLGFSQGDNDFAFGALFGWWNGSGFGVPLVWDHGAFNGMFSFGAEVRFWGDSYRPYSGYWWNGYNYYNGHNLINRPVYTGPNNLWAYDEFGYWSGGVWHPVYRNYGNGYYLIDADGKIYSPIDKKFYKFGIAPNFRIAFHPFGIPALKGKVKIAKVFDPYGGSKLGLSVITYDKNDPLHQGDYRTEPDFPVFTWFFAGVRWYFKEKAALWSEFSPYDISIGFSFKF